MIEVGIADGEQLAALHPLAELTFDFGRAGESRGRIHGDIALRARHQRVEPARLLARFDDAPELKELLEVQLDPDGYCAYTNQDLAVLLAPPGKVLTPEALREIVSEIENRKKRLDRRLRRILAEMQASKEGAHG